MPLQRTVDAIRQTPLVLMPTPQGAARLVLQGTLAAMTLALGASAPPTRTSVPKSVPQKTMGAMKLAFQMTAHVTKSTLQAIVGV